MIIRRGKGKKVTEYGMKELYNSYCANINEGLQVPYSVFTKIIKSFNKKLTSKVIYDSAEVQLPYALGTLRVRKVKINLNNRKTLLVDWGRTNKLWAENTTAKENKTLIYHLNEHRGGYKYSIYWNKTKSRTKHKSYYYFIPARGFKRELAGVLKNNLEIDYYL